MSLIPAELRTGIVRQAPSGLRALNIYNRGAIIPGTPEQVIPGTPEIRIPGSPQQVIPGDRGGVATQEVRITGSFQNITNNSFITASNHGVKTGEVVYLQWSNEQGPRPAGYYQPTGITSGGFTVNSPSFGWASNSGQIVIIRREQISIPGSPARPGSGKSGSFSPAFREISGFPTVRSINTLILIAIIRNPGTTVKINGVDYGGVHNTNTILYHIPWTTWSPAHWEINGEVSSMSLQFAGEGRLSERFRWEPPTPAGANTIIPAVPETIIPAVPDTIIPAVPDRSLGEVVTIGAAAAVAVEAGAYRSVGSGVRALGFTRLRVEGGRLYGAPCSASGTTWPQAVEALAWLDGGYPWFGGAEASARAGTWVRRAAWESETRQIRYERGAGTTRAVAVTDAGTRVTTADFTEAEFLADDWIIMGGGEPAAVDITDLVFSGSGAIPFAVVREPGAVTIPTPTPTPTPTQPQFPTTGEGFPYVRDGQVVRLVPARDLQTELPWRPS